MNQKQIENRALIVTIFVNAIIAVSGIVVYFLTDLQTLFLDGFFSLIALVSTIMAMLISKLSKNQTRYYPQGLYFLEPLYAVFKSLLMIVLMIVALVTASGVAYDYFVRGKGEVMNTAPLPAYAILMTVLCLGLGIFNRSQYIKTNKTSTILHAEYQTNIIDGLQSAVIGVAIVLLKFVPLESALGFLHYTGDFFISLLVIIASIKEPVVLFFDAFRELTGGVTFDKKVIDTVKEVSDLEENQFEVYKIGMKIKVCIRKEEITDKDMVKKQIIQDKLLKVYDNVVVEYVL